MVFKQLRSTEAPGPQTRSSSSVSMNSTSAANANWLRIVREMIDKLQKKGQ